VASSCSEFSRFDTVTHCANRRQAEQVANSIRVVAELRAMAVSLEVPGNFTLKLVDHLVQQDICGETPSSDRVVRSRPEYHDAALTVRSCPRSTPPKLEGRASENRGVDANKCTVKIARSGTAGPIDKEFDLVRQGDQWG
jgi:hypothetical protein